MKPFVSRDVQQMYYSCTSIATQDAGVPDYFELKEVLKFYPAGCSLQLTRTLHILHGAPCTLLERLTRMFTDSPIHTTIQIFT